jgi:hypothetical protein
MSEITRREVLHRLALTIAAAGTVDRLAAQEAHHMVRQAANAECYAPKSLSSHEFLTLQRLTDLIIPAENDKGCPCRPTWQRGSTRCSA